MCAARGCTVGMLLEVYVVARYAMCDATVVARGAHSHSYVEPMGPTPLLLELGAFDMHVVVSTPG